MSDLTNTVQGSGDGGPAFPGDMPTVELNGNKLPFAPGMSLRDWFAGQVLASAAALPFGATDYEHRAKIAYEQADAMLMARKVSP